MWWFFDKSVPNYDRALALRPASQLPDLWGFREMRQQYISEYRAALIESLESWLTPPMEPVKLPGYELRQSNKQFITDHFPSWGKWLN